MPLQPSKVFLASVIPVRLPEISMPEIFAPEIFHSKVFVSRVFVSRVFVSMVLISVVLMSSMLVPAPAMACGGKAITPSCGRTVVVTGASPTPIFTTGGTFTFTQLVYFGLAEFPPGSGLCPGGPFELDLDLTITCTPSGDAAGSVVALPISTGYTEVDVSVVIPAGPPRICTVGSAATVTSTDGAEITGSGGGQVVCIVDEAPTLPGTPRLDLELLPPGPPIARVHPGDQSSHMFLLTNNDPTATFIGGLEAQTQNRSKVPLWVDSGVPGDGVFSPSDPGEADNFPIAFGDEISACVPLPADPLAAAIPIIERKIVLAPGESTLVEILTRPWGMCSDGSCSQSKIEIVGDFSDVTAGLACTSFVTATEIAVPATYLWPDAGATALVQPPVDPLLGQLPFVGFPTPDADPAQVLAMLNGPPLLLPPKLPPVVGNPFAEPLDPERGRIRSLFDLPQPLQPGVPFDVVLPIQFQPDPAGTIVGVDWIAFQWMEGAPVGFENFQPLFMGTLDVTRMIDGLPVTTAFDFTLQLTLFGVDQAGVPLDPIPLIPHLPIPPGSSGLELGLQGVVLPPFTDRELGGGVGRVQLDADFRMYAYRGDRVFSDGFESGDLTAWNSN